MLGAFPVGACSGPGACARAMEAWLLCAETMKKKVGACCSVERRAAAPRLLMVAGDKPQMQQPLV